MGFFKQKLTRRDGTAIFFRTQLFEAESVVPFEFDLNGITKSHVAMITRLRHIPTGRIICTIATHLKASFDERSETQRVLQASQLVETIDRIVGKHERESVAIIVVGDLNDLPGSRVYRLLTTENAYFHLHSAYLSLPTAKRAEVEPVTLIVEENRREVAITLDYIFYTPNLLEPVAILDMPSKDLFPNALPAFNYPSDHFAIAARFQWKR